MVANIRRAIEIFEEQGESLVVAPHLLLGQMDSETMGSQLANFITESASVSEEVKKVQQHKQKLAALFQSESESASESASESGSESGSEMSVAETVASPIEPAAEESKPKGDEDRKATPTAVTSPSSAEEILSNIQYDAEAIRRKISESDAYLPYLATVLELLHSDDTRQSVSANLSRINQRLAIATKDKGRLRSVVATASRCLVESELEEANEILLTLLSKRQSPEELTEILENVVLPAGGELLAERVVVELAERNRKTAVHILSTISRAKGKTLREVATKRLVFLSQNPTLLASWATVDPAGLSRRERFEAVVARIGVDRLTAAFKDFFADTTEEEATRLIDWLSPRVTGAEQVLLSAVEFGSPAIRKAALNTMGQLRSPTVITTLVEIVKRNNYQDQPDLDEVERALNALIEIGTPEVQAFLDEIPQSRGWLRYDYRKGIRNVHSDLLGGEEA